MKKFSKKLRALLIIVILIILVAGGFFLIQKKKRALAQSPLYEAPATLVETATVQQGDLDETHDYLATVESVQSAEVTARVTAAIQDVLVDEGARIQQGQTLLTLDHRQVDSQLDAVQAQIRQAHAELESNQSILASQEKTFSYWVREAERDLELSGKGVIPQSEAEATVEKRNEAEGKQEATRQQSRAIEQQIQTLTARLEELKTTLSYYDIQSPFEGIVTLRKVDPGDQAAPGKTLLVIELAGALLITFDVPQTDLPAIKDGLTATYQANGQTRQATITRIYPSLNRARMVRAEVVLDDNQAAGLTSGEYLTVSASYQQHRNVRMIPVGALIEGTDGNDDRRVFIVKDGSLETRRIRVLGTACEQAAIEGLEPGEQVVIHSFLGWARLADGMKVEAR